VKNVVLGGCKKWMEEEKQRDDEPKSLIRLGSFFL